MELTQIKYFLEVARTEHVTRSAKNLCVAQPALTQAIHKLEAELEVPLFQTQGRNIRLTECGRYFYESLKPLYEDIAKLPGMLRAMARQEGETIHLNVLAASSLVTAAVIQYKRMASANMDLIQNEETSLYDICVRTYAEYEQPAVSDYDNFVFSERIFLAVPNTAAFKKKDSVSLDELQSENFIGLYGSKQFRNICNRFCEQVGLHSRISFESDNVGAVKDAIAAGIGVGFWPEFSWGCVDRRRIRLLEISNAKFKRDIVISCRKNRAPGSCVDDFYKFLVDFFCRVGKARGGTALPEGASR